MQMRIVHERERRATVSSAPNYVHLFNEKHRLFFTDACILR
jgi:hypothetical protein